MSKFIIINMKRYEYNYGKNPEGALSTISGYATETTNFGETAFGILNKSTRDEENFTTPEVVSSSTATLFSVGNGTDHDSRKNIIELKADGTVYINGVGQYDGTNPGEATDIADEFQGIHDDITGLNEDVDRIDNTIESIHISEDDENLIYTLLVDGQERGTINIPRDQFLKNVSYNEETNNLEFTFIVRGENNEEVEKQVDVNMTDLEDIYSAGDGLNLENKQFSVKVDADTQPYIEVSSNGVKIIGINEALDKKVSWDESKKVITLPADGSISALRNNGLEGGVLVCQRTYDDGATYVTEVGTTKNNLTLNSIERPKIDFAGGTSENIAYESEVKSLQDRMSTAETDIDNLEGRMDTAESDIDTIQSDLSDLVGDGEGSVQDQIKTALEDYLPLTGGTLTGNVEMENADLTINHGNLTIKDGLNGNILIAPTLGMISLIAESVSNTMRIQKGISLAQGGYYPIAIDYSSEYPCIRINQHVDTTFDLSLTKDGVTIKDKTENDLLNAAGGTYDISGLETKVDDSLNNFYLNAYSSNQILWSASFKDNGTHGTSVKLSPATKINSGAFTSTDFYIYAPLVTSEANGVMSKEDKTKLDSIDTDALATKDDLNGYLPLTGGTVTGILKANGPAFSVGGHANFNGGVDVNVGDYVGFSVNGNTGLGNTPGVSISARNIYILDNSIDAGTGDEVGMIISKEGISVSGKAEQDLLNAAGSTTSISDIIAKVPQPDLSPYATKEEVGSNIYTDSNYLGKETNLTDAVLQLDEEIKATNDNLDLEHANAEATYAKKTELGDYLTRTDASNTYQPKGNYLTAIPSEYVTDSELNAKGYQTEAQVAAKVSALVDSAPETLDTLNELAAALGDDPNFATTVTNQIASKQDKLVSGTNIKTINGQTLLGEGDIDLSDYVTTENLGDYLKVPTLAETGSTNLDGWYQIVGKSDQNNTFVGGLYYDPYASRLKIADMTSSNDHCVQIDRDGINVYSSNSDVVAHYGSGMRIGKDQENRIETIHRNSADTDQYYKNDYTINITSNYYAASDVTEDTDEFICASSLAGDRLSFNKRTILNSQGGGTVYHNLEIGTDKIEFENGSGTAKIALDASDDKYGEIRIRSKYTDPCGNEWGDDLIIGGENSGITHPDYVNDSTHDDIVWNVQGGITDLSHKYLSIDGGTIFGTSAQNYANINADRLTYQLNGKQLDVEASGITLRDDSKEYTTSDLLNAAGSTTSIDDIKAAIGNTGLTYGGSTANTDDSQLKLLVYEGPNTAYSVNDIYYNAYDGQNQLFINDDVFVQKLGVNETRTGNSKITIIGNYFDGSGMTTGTMVITPDGIKFPGADSRNSFTFYNTNGAITDLQTISDELKRNDQFLPIPSDLPGSNQMAGSDPIILDVIANYLDESTHHTANIPIEYYYSYSDKHIDIGRNGSVSVKLHGTVTVNGKRVVSSSTRADTIWTGTQSEYEAVGTKDANTLYFITEG